MVDINFIHMENFLVYKVTVQFDSQLHEMTPVQLES